MKNEVLELRREGIFCPAGDFYIDPRGKVDRALITHAHSDHGRPGHNSYLCSDTCKSLLKIRIGKDAVVESLPFGEKIKIGNSLVSFHPAGHILGSAQIRVEVNGRVWVVSGDYKPQEDQTCEPFELLKCNGFITECTFGLPVYRWLPEEKIHQQINEWWLENKQDDKPSLLFSYSLGKAQRVLAGLRKEIGSIYVHSAVYPFLEHYEQAGIKLPQVMKIERGKEYDFNGSIIIAPPAVEDSTWTRKFRSARKGFASGWMAIRGARRRRNLDRGFILSDHADWNGLIDVIKGTGAEEIKVTHGNGDALTRYLGEQGMNCSILSGASIRGEEEE
ncbi:ligase-associated DNA damage response exonuclease [Opitutales bacterium]|nr:ligase-associated DNA damage response exonuclease [Opitutales bacterium]